MSNYLNRLIFLCATLLLTSSLMAEESRWYQVEVVLFAHNSQTFRDTEYWPIDYRPPSIEGALGLLPAEPDSTIGPAAFSTVRLEARQLMAEAERIRADQSLSLLSHLGWYQPGLASEQARGVYIRVPQDGDLITEQPLSDTETELPAPRQPPVLEGVLTLSLSRYLHMNVDLLYRQAIATIPNTAVGTVESGSLYQSSEETHAWRPESAWQVYRLEETRRMRSNELHYLDHPLFGALILITPVEGIATP